MLKTNDYEELLRYARKVVKRADEAEDLLQTILLACVEAGRTDFGCSDNQRWLRGALRKRALFDARSAVRRRSREATVLSTQSSSCATVTLPSRFISTLSPSLRITALLVLTGHTRAEISWLLRLSDTALRQRIVTLKKSWRRFNGQKMTEIPGLTGPLRFGQIRQALIKPVRHNKAVLASHDPDGNLFIICSQKHMGRQQEVK